MEHLLFNLFVILLISPKETTFYHINHNLTWNLNHIYLKIIKQLYIQYLWGKVNYPSWFTNPNKLAFNWSFFYKQKLYWTLQPVHLQRISLLIKKKKQRISLKPLKVKPNRKKTHLLSHTDTVNNQQSWPNSLIYAEIGGLVWCFWVWFLSGQT